MTSNGLENVMLSAPNVIKPVKEIVKPGTAKLLIDPDGTVRLEGNSNFPTPGTHDKQTLFAACTDDGQTNVYYSPSGNPSEVYLLKPTAKSAGKQLRLTTREPTNIKASTVEDQPSKSDQDQSNPIVMSMIGQNTVLQKPSSLPSSLPSTKSLSQGIPSTAILSPPSVCSLATSTSSSPVDSPVDDSDFPIDLPVSFEADIKDSGVNSDMDELDSLLPDIGSTIAAHLQNKDSQQTTVSQKENLINSLLTQKQPVMMPYTTMANNASVKIPISYKNMATKPVPMTNSQGQLLLFTSSTGQNQCIYLSENEKLPPGLVNITKSIPTKATNSSFPPTGDTFKSLQSSFKLTGATAPSKQLNTVSLLKGPVSQKTAPRILTASNHPQTKPIPPSQPISVPIIVMPKSTPTTNNYLPLNNIQTHVPIKVLPKTIPTFANTNVMHLNSGNPSGLKFISSNISSNIKQIPTQNTNLQSTTTEIVQSTASQYLKQIVTKVCDSTQNESVTVVFPKVSSAKSIVCENINNSNNKADDDVQESEDTSCNIRIDSVFSLSEPSQTTEQSEERTKKDGKRKRKNVNKDKKFKIVTEVKEYKCKPMYVVLERLALSKNTVNIHDYTLSKTKCTDYCRKRTLNCLCGIDLLDCKNPVLSSKANYLHRRRIEITPCSPNKVARHLSDTDVKSRCNDDWTLVEEVSKEITTTANQVHKPSVPRDHSSYTSACKSSDFTYGNQQKFSRNTVTMPPTNVTVSKVHSTQQAFDGALKNAVASNIVPGSTTETKSTKLNLSTLIKIPLTVSSTKPPNPSVVTGTVSSSTSTTSTTSTTATTYTTIPAPLSKAPENAKQNVLNGKFYLVTIDGKNVLIPTDKSVNNKAFVLQQSADGTTGLIPACLSYNKVTPTAPINTTASQRLGVNTSQSVMNIRSIAPRMNSLVASNTNSLVASNTKTSMTSIPTGPTVPHVIQSPRQSITPANVSKPQAVYMVPNTRLATSDTKTKSPNIQTIIARPSNTDTPSPTIDPTKKRKKTLAERYPLPPGVIIKQEPRTTGYGDEPTKVEVIKPMHPTPLPVTPNRSRLVQSVLTPFVIPRPATTPTSTILTLTNTTVNSRSLLKNTAPIQSTGSINRSISVPATNIRTVNVLQPNTQSRNPPPPINIVKHFPVTYFAPHLAKAPPIIAPIMKNNTITFTKLPNTNAFQQVTTTTTLNSSMPLKTPENATDRPIPVLTSREQSVNNEIVENNSRPGSPGPPDLGEPQITLPPRVAQQASNNSDTDSDTESASYPFPVFTSPLLEKRHEEPKAKTPQELRIQKLKEQLREQERALDVMRKKKAFECPIDVDDDD